MKFLRTWLTINPETVKPGEARFDTEDHEHRWYLGNNIWGDPYAECACAATAELGRSCSPS